MREPSNETSGSPTRADLCVEIDRMMTSLWQRRSGVRPVSVSTEYVGDVVRCRIEEGESPPDGDDAPEVAIVNSIDTRGYKHEAQGLVERLTKRRVLGFIAKHPDDHLSTNAFILEAVRVRH
jgi:hypothetical protein